MGTAGSRCHRCGNPADTRIAAFDYCNPCGSRLLEHCFANARRRIFNNPTDELVEHAYNIGLFTPDDVADALHRLEALDDIEEPG